MSTSRNHSMYTPAHHHNNHIVLPSKEFIFTGKNCNFFVTRFEIYMEMSQRLEEDYGTILQLHCTSKVFNRLIKMKGYLEKNWSLLKSELLETYAEDERDFYTLHDLRQVLRKLYKKGPISNIPQLTRAFRAVTAVSTSLKQQQVLSWQSESSSFMKLFSKKVIRAIENKRKVKNLLVIHPKKSEGAEERHIASKAYTIEEIRSEVEELFLDEQTNHEVKLLELNEPTHFSNSSSSSSSSTSSSASSSSDSDTKHRQV